MEASWKRLARKSKQGGRWITIWEGSGERPSPTAQTRPHSKLGWLTPQAYADALNGQIGRSAALVEGCADRPLANPTNPVQITKGLSLWLDEKGVTSLSIDQVVSIPARDAWSLALALKNSGQSPALDVRRQAGCGFTPDKARQSRRQLLGGEVAPGAGMPSPGCAIPFTDFELRARAGQPIFVDVAAQYSDIYGKKYAFEECAAVLIASTDGVPINGTTPAMWGLCSSWMFEGEVCTAAINQPT